MPLAFPCEGRPHPRFKPLDTSIRSAALLSQPPWIRGLGQLSLNVTTQGWRFPLPPDQPVKPPPAKAQPKPEGELVPLSALPPEALEECPVAELSAGPEARIADGAPVAPTGETRLKPPREAVVFKERLLYLLQPPLESLFGGKIELPFQPFPYQVAGIAFLMPRHNALIADEMGLGKTVQVIVSLRLLLHAGILGKTLIVCPKPLVINWMRELRLWAPDVPFEVVAGDTETRRAIWQVSNCPVKLVNYEVLTRDVDFAADEKTVFDLVVIDEAQRIKSRDSKTAQAVCSLRRQRSWAMSGTPVENRVEDMVNIFAFAYPGLVPPDTPARMVATLTSDHVLRRTKDMVVKDMPPRIIKDLHLELSPAQREAYDKAEKECVIELNNMGDTITVPTVFERIIRLKQICNFDLRTGESAKLEQLKADMEEVAANGRKAIVFSQWTQPLERIAEHLRPYGPLLYHGKVPHGQRQPILDRFKSDPSKHLLLMSYGTGSVGLNLQFTNYVFLFDRWWNPAIEDQAINRAHRLGQKEAVFVSRFVSTGTIEERIAEVLEQKRALFNEMIEGNGPPPSLGMTESEIFGLFDIKARPKR
ncbi:MAG: DEAD/DEAH box helicase [Gemmataceae bacterium]|nr:DEAD/DEAH box helicase [Gemmataceae bacterium]